MHHKTDLTVRGRVAEAIDGGVLRYVAAAPPDYRTSFTGSGLPFGSSKQAFDNTPNQGRVRVTPDGRFEVPLAYPNAYYDQSGTVLVEPTLYLSYDVAGREVKRKVPLGGRVPYRDVAWPKLRTGADFYAAPGAQEVRSQERILRDSAYPSVNRQAPDFWGRRPPL